LGAAPDEKNGGNLVTIGVKKMTTIKKITKEGGRRAEAANRE